jgi:hypothetical protein
MEVAAVCDEPGFEALGGAGNHRIHFRSLGMEPGARAESDEIRFVERD